MNAKYCPCLAVKLFEDIATRSIHLRLSRRRGKMNIRYRVELSEAERSELGSLLRGGQHAARKLKRAQILLAADAGVPDETIAQSLGVGGSTVYRTKRHFVEGTLGKALHEESRPGARRKLTGQEEALLVATACSRPPEGRARWTMELLAGEMVRLTQHDSVSRETVRRRLAENELKPWREMWCVPKIDGSASLMEDVLDLYAEPLDPARPVVCLDESPLQLIGEVREPIPAAPGQLERVDYEYRRNGTVNLFVAVDAHRPWRKVTVTEQRTARDYASGCANSSTWTTPMPGASGWCRTTCPPIRPARSTRPSRPPRRIASWSGWSSTTPPSTPVGSTWSRLRSGCSNASAWTGASTTARSSSARSPPGSASYVAGARLKWMFTTEKARTKMGRAYPRPAAALDHN